jgi:(2R)-ethylmalonyl-CoA mutase
VDGVNERDKPWLFRTYAGHSNAAESNALYRSNLSKGQTGLSIAFDLPTQTGYDSDHELSRGEVGKVGVTVAHLGDMRTLFDGIPLDTMNTSMTINAPAAWLLALYLAVADEQGVSRAKLQGTTQNDIIKEYLSRGTYVFPPAPSMRLIKDVVLFTTARGAALEPDERLFLPPAGGGGDAGPGAGLRARHAIACSTRARGGRGRRGVFAEAVARISFFVNAGLRFVTRSQDARLRGALDEITAERYGITTRRSACSATACR